MIKPWRVRNRRIVYSAPPFLEVAVEDVELPNGNIVKGYHQIASGSFATVVPETGDGQFLLLCQYRHGVRRVGLTLPSGRIEDQEDPLEAAKRELLEETGLESSNWENLANYAISCTYGFAKNYYYHARNARRIRPPQTDDLEESDIVMLTRPEAIAALYSGEIASLGHAAPLAFVLLRESTGACEGR